MTEQTMVSYKVRGDVKGQDIVIFGQMILSDLQPDSITSAHLSDILDGLIVRAETTIGMKLPVVTILNIMSLCTPDINKEVRKQFVASVMCTGSHNRTHVEYQWQHVFSTNCYPELSTHNISELEKTLRDMSAADGIELLTHALVNITELKMDPGEVNE